MSDLNNKLSRFDPNHIVAWKVEGQDAAAPGSFYGKNAEGEIGWWPLDIIKGPLGARGATVDSVSASPYEITHVLDSGDTLTVDLPSFAAEGNSVSRIIRQGRNILVDLDDGSSFVLVDIIGPRGPDGAIGPQGSIGIQDFRVFGESLVIFLTNGDTVDLGTYAAGDMSTNQFDLNKDGVVDIVNRIDSSEEAGNNTFYGVDSGGLVAWIPITVPSAEDSDRFTVITVEDVPAGYQHYVKYDEPQSTWRHKAYALRKEEDLPNETQLVFNYINSPNFNRSIEGHLRVGEEGVIQNNRNQYTVGLSDLTVSTEPSWYDTLVTPEDIATPIKTSDLLPEGWVTSASSIQNTTYQAWRAFDQLYRVDTRWMSAAKPAGVSIDEENPEWIQIDCPTLTEISGYSITNPNSANSTGLTTWKLQGTNILEVGEGDEIVWDTIHEVPMDTRVEHGVTREFQLQEPVTYLRYRLLITGIAPNGTYSGQRAELSRFDLLKPDRSTVDVFTPIMTNNIATLPMMTGYTLTGDQRSSSWPLWLALGNRRSIAEQGWVSANVLPTYAAPQVWQINLPEKRYCTGYSVSMLLRSNPSSPHYYPEDWDFQGSNDNTSWTSLHRVRGSQVQTPGATLEFKGICSAYFRHYRIAIYKKLMIDSDTTNYVGFGSINLLGANATRAVWQTEALRYLGYDSIFACGVQPLPDDKDTFDGYASDYLVPRATPLPPLHATQPFAYEFPNGVVVGASGEYSASYRTRLAFNRTHSGRWIGTNGQSSGWIQVQFPAPTWVTSYEVYQTVYEANIPTTWRCLISEEEFVPPEVWPAVWTTEHDSITFTEVDAVYSHPPLAREVIHRTLAKPTLVRTLRIQIDEVQGSYVAVGALNLYGLGIGKPQGGVIKTPEGLFRLDGTPIDTLTEEDFSVSSGFVPAGEYEEAQLLMLDAEATGAAVNQFSATGRALFRFQEGLLVSNNDRIHSSSLDYSSGLGGQLRVLISRNDNTWYTFDSGVLVSKPAPTLSNWDTQWGTALTPEELTSIPSDVWENLYSTTSLGRPDRINVTLMIDVPNPDSYVVVRGLYINGDLRGDWLKMESTEVQIEYLEDGICFICNLAGTYKFGYQMPRS